MEKPLISRQNLLLYASNTSKFPAAANRTFSEKDHIHLKLSELSEAAHKAAASGDAAEIKRIEEEVDRIAAKLWNLTEEELSEIRACLEELS